MMKFSDQQLSDILKQVELPPDLKAQLLKIPQQDSLNVLSESNAAIDLPRDLPKFRSRRTRTIGWLSLATTACLFFGLMWINRPESTEVSLVEASVKPPNATAVDLEDRSLVLDIESMSRQSNLEALKLVQLQSEIGDIEEQIDAVKSNRLAGIDYQLGVDECTSLTIAAAAQSAILSGVSLEYLRNDLEESTHRFPETRGSALAAQLLASTAVQN